MIISHIGSSLDQSTSVQWIPTFLTLSFSHVGGRNPNWVFSLSWNISTLFFCSNPTYAQNSRQFHRFCCPTAFSGYILPTPLFMAKLLNHFPIMSQRFPTTFNFPQNFPIICDISQLLVTSPAFHPCFVPPHRGQPTVARWRRSSPRWSARWATAAPLGRCGPWLRWVPRGTMRWRRMRCQRCRSSSAGGGFLSLLVCWHLWLYYIRI